MRIVIVNHYAGGPKFGMEFRPYYFAREWVKAGHEVLIVGASFSHVRSRQPEFSGSVGTEVVDGVEYMWLRTNAYSGNGLGRVLNIFQFVARLFISLPRKLRDFRPDVIVSSSTYPLDNLPLKAAARRFGAKLCYEVHDLWPLSPIELGGMSRRHPFIMVMQWAENYAYRHCDFVVSMLPCAAPHMVEHGMAPAKFNYIPNGIVVEDWDRKISIPPEQMASLRQIRDKFSFCVAYAGSHGLANTLDSFIETSPLVGPGVALVLIGDGPEKPWLQRMVADRGYQNVFFLKPVLKQFIPAILSEFDSLFVGLQKQSLFRFGISPNKLIDYMMAGKPIILAVEAGNNMVEEHKCGISVEPENRESIANAINKLSSLSSAERDAMGKNGNFAARNFHDYKILAGRFIQVAEGAKKS